MDGEVARPLPPGAETSSSRTITPIPKSSHAWGAWGPHPEAPLSHPWAPQAQRGPLLPIHKEPSTHGSASQGCIFCILLSKVGGGEDAGAKPCRTDLCSGPENGSKLQNSRKIKKKNKPLRLLVHPLVGADRLLSYSYEPAWEEEREHLYLFH